MKQRKVRLRIVAIGVIIVAPVAIITWEMVVQPVRTMVVSSEALPLIAPSAEPAYANAEPAADTLPAVQPLLNESKFWRARLEAARRDSMYITLDMVDSMLYLEIKGVTLRSSPLERFTISSLLEDFKARGLGLPGGEHPLALRETKSLIPKIPMRILDMSAAADSSDTRPPPADTSGTRDDASMIFLFEPDLTLYVKQAEPMTGEGWRAHVQQRIQRRMETLEDEIYRVFRGKPLKPDLWISVELPYNDLVAVYRAIPHSARLVVRL